ncbi:MAG: class II fructose-bisphosphate aldolase [Candidatus Scalinduaceae bacterium]
MCDAAAETSSPVIIQVSRNALKYADKGLLTAMVKYMAEEKYPHIPMSLHLDHGPDIDTIRECIALGFTSVMIDGSLDYSTKDEKEKNR